MRISRSPAFCVRTDLFPEWIVRWVEEETAVCPHCGVDAVVGSALGNPTLPGCCAGS
jgi:hypothetical protein